MEHKDVKVGMNIRIISLARTHRLYNTNSKMTKMLGKVFKITEVRPSHKSGEMYKVCLNNTTFVWAPEDLRPMSLEAKTPKKATFNPD